MYFLCKNQRRRPRSGETRAHLEAREGAAAAAKMTTIGLTKRNQIEPMAGIQLLGLELLSLVVVVQI